MWEESGPTWEEYLGLAQRAPLPTFIAALGLMCRASTLEQVPPSPDLPARQRDDSLAEHWGALVRCALDPLDSQDEGGFVSKASFLALVARFGPIQLLRSRLAELLDEGSVVAWFHGPRSRRDAERDLRNAPDGGMLVRFSSRAPDRLVVSSRGKGKSGVVRHSFVQNGPDGFSLDGVGAPFPSLTALVRAVALPPVPTPLRLIPDSPRRRAQLLLDLDWAALGLDGPAEPQDSSLALLRAVEPLESALRRGLEELLPAGGALCPVLRALLAPQLSVAGVAQALDLPTSVVTHADVIKLFASPDSPPPPPPFPAPATPPPPGRLVVPPPEPPPVYRGGLEPEVYCDGLVSEYDILGTGADGDGVAFAPYAPRSLPPGAVSEVAVWACRAAEREALLQRLMDVAEACSPACCSEEVFHGQLITIELCVPPPLVLQDGATKHIVWSGAPDCCKFAVLAPATAAAGVEVPCSATVLVGRLCLTLRFALRVGNDDDGREEPPPECAIPSSVETTKPAGRIIERCQLQLHEEIGRGVSAVAYLATLEGEGTVVVKQFLEGSAVPEAASSEWRVLQLVGRHPNVVRCLGVVEGPALVLEHASGGSLDALLQDGDVDSADAGPEVSGPGFTFDDRLRMARDACRGLAHLHSAGIVHRDVAARNCLLQADGRVVLSDFGLAAERPPNAAEGALLTGSASGPLRWMAPEQLQPPHMASFKSDVWAAGVLVWELLSGARPSLTAEQVVSGQRLPMKEEWPAEIRALLARCFDEDPSKRPSSVEMSLRLGA